MINKELFKNMLEQKYVSVQKHPNANLFIYNYTQTVQYEKKWNEVTLQTRGLILDDNMNIIARPITKFFNLSEHTSEEIPDLPFEVYEKLDGSLGIIYFLDNKPFIASRGSFISDQANHANKILYTKYEHIFEKLDRNKTYVVEIIYPSNRIVVDYSGLDDIILLGIIDTKTGNDLPLEDIGLPIVKRYDGINDINELKTLEESNKEGFVVKFNNGFRVKVKFDEYVKLHRIITGVSSIVVWEYLSSGLPFDELLEKVPDEFFNWVKKTKDELQANFDKIKQETEDSFWTIINRKEFAEKAKNDKHTSLLFTRLASYSENLDKQIWNKIKPEFSKPFSNIEN